MVDQRVEGLDTEMPLGNPADDLDVPQTARAALDVGFQVVGGVAVPMMPRDLFLAFFGKELGRRPQPVGRDGGLQRFVKRGRAGKQTRFHQRSRDREVLRRLLAALFYAAHAVADLEADVPQRSYETGQLGFAAVRQILRQQQHDVDIGRRMQLAATIAAHGNQADDVSAGIGMGAPQVAEQLVHDGCPEVDEINDRVAGEKALANVAAGKLQGVTAAARGLVLQRFAQDGQCRVVGERPVPFCGSGSGHCGVVSCGRRRPA